MSFTVKVAGRTLEIPREVEAKGPQAVQRWIREHTPGQSKKKRTKKTSAQTAATTTTPSAETES